MVSKIDAANNASEVVSSVNMLMAIRWVALAWWEVKETKITKCLKNAGILNDTLDVVEVTSEDPFQDVDEISLQPWDLSIRALWKICTR